MTTYKDLGTPPPEIATREEFDRRRAAREARMSAPQPTPAGPDADAIREHFETEDEKRSTEIERKLAALDKKIEIDHAFARLDGFARAHFQHSR